MSPTYFLKKKIQWQSRNYFFKTVTDFQRHKQEKNKQKQNFATCKANEQMVAYVPELRKLNPMPAMEKAKKNLIYTTDPPKCIKICCSSYLWSAVMKRLRR